MNAKYALALILALQVSSSLCDVPAPSQELVDKYNEMRTVFMKRLMKAYGRVQEVAAPLMEKIGESERGQSARTYAEGVQAKPEFQAVVKVATGLAEEVGPLVEKARVGALGVYEAHMRSEVGPYLSDIIDHIKAYLDLVAPSE